MKCYVFAGQGSQFLGMGNELFDKYVDIIKKADSILGYSVIDLCTRQEEKLNFTQYTQPAMFIINYLLYLNYIEENGEPDFLAGHSLGEYNALVASGALKFEDALFLVKKRAELMSEADFGAMFAITRINYLKVKEIFEKKKLNDLFIANYNSIHQTVVSGNADSINKVKDEIEELKGKVVKLKVSGAFHSKYMSEAKNKFVKYLEQIELEKLNIPVISNLQGKEYDDKPKSILADQIDNPVRWVDSIKYLLNIDNNMEFIQISYGSTLIRLINDIKKNQYEPK